MILYIVMDYNATLNSYLERINKGIEKLLPSPKNEADKNSRSDAI